MCHMGHTVLPSTRHRWHSPFTSAKASDRLSDPWGTQGWVDLHRESKKQDTKLLAKTNYHPIFKIFFTSGLSNKLATNSCLNIPPHLKHVATLPCEIWMSEKWHHSEIHIAINDELQSSIAENLKCDELLYYTFIVHSAGERIFKMVNIWRSYRQNGWLCHTPHSPWTFVLKDADLVR